MHSALSLLILLLALLLLPAWLRAWAVLRAAAGLAMAGVGVVGLLGLAGPASPQLAWPVGPPWLALGIGADPLGAGFLLLLGIAGGAAALASGPAARGELLALPGFLLGATLAAAAQDGYGLLLGLQLAWIAAWAGRPGAPLPAGLAGGAALLAALALLGAASGAPRAAPAGMAAAALLVVFGATALAMPGRHPPRPIAAALLPMLALFAAFRLLADTAWAGGLALVLPEASRLALPLPPASGLALALPPVAWLALAPTFAAAALFAARRALLATPLPTIGAGTALASAALGAAALAAALAFRAADLTPPAALGFAAALLFAAQGALAGSLLLLAGQAAARAAGQDEIGALGGLGQRMPIVAAAACIAAATLAMLPGTAGFAALWLLAQALFAAPRLGDTAALLAALAALAGTGMTAALLGAAMLRAIGLGFLGRPRSPRVAGAEDAAGPWRPALLLPAIVLAALGALPGPALLLAAPALARLGSGVPPAGWWSIEAGEGLGGYPALALWLLLGSAALLLARGAAWRAPPPAMPAPPWTGGFIAAPPHLPFGDPALRPAPAGLAAAVAGVLPVAPPRTRRPHGLARAMLRGLHRQPWPLPPMLGGVALLALLLGGLALWR